MTFDLLQNQYYFLLILGLLGVYFLYRRNGKKTEQFLSEFFQEKKLPFTRRRTFRFFSILIALSFGILALMGPKWGLEEVETQSKGHEIVFILDHSESMLAKDISLDSKEEEYGDTERDTEKGTNGYTEGYRLGNVSRFAFSKNLLGQLIDFLDGYKIAFILASRIPQIEVPFTLNRRLVKELYLEKARIASTRLQGTNLAPSLEAALNLVSPESSSTKVLLVSDGEDHGSNIDLVLGHLKSKNIPVFTVGLGTKKGAYIPTPNKNYPFKVDAYGNWVISSLNETLLKKIAYETKGEYFSFQSPNLLSQIKESLDLDRSLEQETGTKTLQKKEQFQIFLLIGFFFFIGSFWFYSFRIGGFKKSFFSHFFLIVLVFLLTAGLSSEEQKGSDYYSEQEYQKAIEEYSGGIQKKEKTEEKTPQLHFHRGNSYYRLDQYTESEKDYYRGMSQTERSELESLFLYNLGKTAFEQKKFSESLGFYRKSLEADPSNQDARHNYYLLKRSIETQEILIEGEGDEGEETVVGPYPLDTEEEYETRGGVNDSEIQDRLSEIYRRDQENRLRMNEKGIEWSWNGNKDW